MYAKTLNVEIKARCADLDQVRLKLRELNAVSRGVDEQTDTYFVVRDGRMKLREGTIENSLIYYRRATQAGPKVSRVSRFDLGSSDGALKVLLAEALAVLTVVRKTREIYFLSNIKIHLDEVRDIGSFLEIEAIDAANRMTEAQLDQQCRGLMNKLGVSPDDLVEGSYSDMLGGETDGREFADAA